MEKWIKIESIDNIIRTSHAEGMNWVDVFGILDIAILNKKDEYLTGITVITGEQEDGNTSTSTETNDNSSNNT